MNELFLSLRLSTKIHIVVDNSNLFIGAQQGQGENGIQDFAIRINVGNLVKIIEKNKKAENIKTRIVGGSKPPPTSKVWDEWKKYNYNCILGNRTAENKVFIFFLSFYLLILFYIRKNF